MTALLSCMGMIDFKLKTSRVFHVQQNWPFSNHTASLWCFSQKVTIIAMFMGNRTPVTDLVVCEEDWKYHYHWLGVQAEIGSSECMRLIPLISQGNRIRSWLWSPVFKANQLIRDFIDLQSVLIKNCLPQTTSCNMSPGLPSWYWVEWLKDSTVSGDALSAAHMGWYAVIIYHRSR